MGTKNSATSQNVPGRASAGHSRRVARSWPGLGSATGLELGPGLTPQSLGARTHLVEREPGVEVLGQDHCVQQVLRDVALVDQELGGQLRQRRLVAVQPQLSK